MLLVGCSAVLAHLLGFFPVLPLATPVIFCEVFVVSRLFSLLLIALWFAGVNYWLSAPLLLLPF